MTFLVGAERSGTTVLRLMLDHHPQVAWLQEFEYAVDCMDDDEGWPDLDGYYEWLASHRVFQDRGLEVDRSLDYPELVRSFLAQHQRRSGKPLAGATVHRHFDRLLRIWPEARFLHIVRDPRDVSRSNVAIGWAGNMYTGVKRWIDAERLWDRMREALAGNRYLEIRQEELIRQPEQVLTRICEFLGVSYSPRMLDYPVDTTYDAPDATLVAQWRRKATDQEVRLVEARVGDLLIKCGYELSGLPAAEITPLTRMFLITQDRLARAAFRLRRYGLRLWFSELVARRLSLRERHRNLLSALHGIDRSFLK